MTQKSQAVVPIQTVNPKKSAANEITKIPADRSFGAISSLPRQLFSLVHSVVSLTRDSRALTPRTRRSRPHVVGDARANACHPPVRRGDDVSRAARGPAARGRTTDKKGMRRPRGDQAPRSARSRRPRLARAGARDRDARRRRDDFETGPGGVAQRAPPGSAPERARLFVLPGDA